MQKVYLNTTENIFLDEYGQIFRDGFPRLTVGGKETFEILLVKSSPDYGTEAAKPDNWEPDAYWASVDGVSAMLTVDSDYIQRIAGKLSAEASAGAMEIRADIGNAEDIPLTGSVRIYSPSGAYEEIAYTGRNVSCSSVSFVLGTALRQSYPQATAVDCKQSPLATCYLNAGSSDWSRGKLVFDLDVDSFRLRQETAYNNSATISIPGMELLLFSTSDNVTQKIRAFLWDSVTLWKTQGDPGNAAPVPDAEKNYIAAEIQRQLQGLSPGGGGGGSTNASDIIISAESEYYAGMDVASALQQIGAELDGLEAELEGI